LVLAYAGWLPACEESPANAIPLSRLADGGFARNARVLERWRGREPRLLGFVDHGNLYGDGEARDILGERWAGPGPADGIWRFDLKGAADDPVGRSFAVHLPANAGAAALFRRFAADAVMGRPTRVRVSGRLHGFSAPTQARRLVGLYLVLGLSRAVAPDRPEPPADPREE
jgi:hypothetical protein